MVNEFEIRKKIKQLEIARVRIEAKLEVLNEVIATEEKFVEEIHKRGPYKKRKEQVTKKVSGRGRKSVFTPEAKEYIKRLVNDLNTREIVTELKKKFGIKTNVVQLGKWMWDNKIKIKHKWQGKTKIDAKQKIKEVEDRAAAMARSGIDPDTGI